MAIGAAEVSFYIDGLIRDIKHSGDDCSRIGTASNNLADTSSHLANTLQTISQSINHTANASQQADQRLQSSVTNINKLAEAVTHAAEQLQQLRSSADDIQRITDVINNVADQTNLLALNAAIEAARAGEQGRGFAVVAEEVRALAGKTSTATQDIARMLGGIREQSQQTSELMNQLEGASEQVKQELQQLAAGFNDINAEINQASSSLEHIEQASTGLQNTSVQISQAITGINQALSAIESKGETVAHQAIDLSGETESIYRELSSVSDHNFYTPLQQEAQQAAIAVARVLEQLISSGQLSEQQLFAEEYQPVSNTNPPKYHTAYDKFTDQLFPDIQEPILNRHNNVLYAGAVDRKGYFPTHNKKYSQPLTGDYQKDLLHNRSKRIFDDRTGSRCGSNNTAMLLQTYKRDTGEILHDLSVPITVNGRHWGGFRIGFKR
ncbi:methyl-accepting chemotaxis protein [Chromatiaceae bacterium AAb-1]|nr:methyl-accepting chemotaxis protein [Chromatiaceae bacterium AAb-1]